MKQLLLGLVLVCTALPSFAATCKISEYRVLADDSRGNEIQVALEPSITTQSVTYTTSAQSAALNDETRFIRVVCDAKAHFKISTAGTNAAATDPFIAADSPEYFGVQPNRDLIIDFYDGSS
jgi:hypothetical protein